MSCTVLAMLSLRWWKNDIYGRELGLHNMIGRPLTG